MLTKIEASGGVRTAVDAIAEENLDRAGYRIARKICVDDGLGEIFWQRAKPRQTKCTRSRALEG